MSKRDPRIDKLIDASPDLAKPILTHMRELIHRVCPEVEETLKWSHPTFMYKGIMCGMASFKQHCLFMFWNHELMFQHDKKATEAMIERLGRLTSISELPPDKILISYLKEALRLKDEGVKPVK